MSDARKNLGQQGEQAAAQWLEDKGYQVVARNYRSRLGEIDLVATQGEYLVFIEVKTRQTGSDALHPSMAVNARKQAKIRQVAEQFLLEAEQTQAHWQGLQPRFDVVSLTRSKHPPPPFEVEHWENAF